VVKTKQIKITKPQKQIKEQRILLGNTVLAQCRARRRRGFFGYIKAHQPSKLRMISYETLKEQEGEILTSINSRVGCEMLIDKITSADLYYRYVQKLNLRFNFELPLLAKYHKVKSTPPERGVLNLCT